MWFEKIAESENPEKKELLAFVGNVREFLGFVLENTKNFSFLWEGASELRELAWQTFNSDIAKGAGLELDRAISDISQTKLVQHSLEGRPLSFKFKVLHSIGNQWNELKDQFSIRQWFKKLIDAIDAILDSLIDAAGGAGGLIKEFKDALGALWRNSHLTSNSSRPSGCDHGFAVACEYGRPVAR